MDNKTKWQDYEEVTKHIYDQLGKLDGIKILGYGHNCKLEGKSAVKHQFDVLAETSVDGKIGIECKHWNRKVNEDVVAVVYNHMDDCGIKLGVIVSVKGFTYDAIKMAKFRDIELAILKDIERSDFDGSNRLLETTVNITHSFQSFFIDVPYIKLKKSHGLKENDLSKLDSYNNGNQVIFYANGEEENLRAYLNKNANNMACNRVSNEIKEIEKEFIFSENTFISSDGINRLPLYSITIKIFNIRVPNSNIKSKIKVSYIDNYRKIFHVLFSGQKYILNDKGEIELIDVL